MNKREFNIFHIENGRKFRLRQADRRYNIDIIEFLESKLIITTTKKSLKVGVETFHFVIAKQISLRVMLFFMPKPENVH